MTPDQAHEAYYKENPTGNHLKPSDETLRFMEKQNEINERTLETLGEIKTDIAVIKMTTESIHEQTKKTNGRVNALEEYSPMLDDICEERKNTKSKINDTAWEIIKMILVGVLVVVGTAVWETYFK